MNEIVHIKCEAVLILGWFFQGVPVSVVQPHRIGFHGILILIPVPTEEGMSPVLYFQHPVPETGLPEGRVAGLRLRKPTKIHGNDPLFFFQKLESLAI